MKHHSAENQCFEYLNAKRSEAKFQTCECGKKWMRDWNVWKRAETLNLNTNKYEGNY